MGLFSVSPKDAAATNVSPKPPAFLGILLLQGQRRDPSICLCPLGVLSLGTAWLTLSPGPLSSCHCWDLPAMLWLCCQSLSPS